MKRMKRIFEDYTDLRVFTDGSSLNNPGRVSLILWICIL